MNINVSANESANHAALASQLPLDTDVQVAPLGGLLKRALDVSIASLALIWFSPLFLLVALLIKLTDRGPVLYRHMRVGHGGQLFPCLKFRTMVVNSDEVLRRHLQTSPDAAREWAATRKLKDDPRITSVGAVLRRLSLDELPQLINILRGQMSIVGPRPVVFDELALYGQDAGYYLRSRPGLTGAWQINGRNDVSYGERVAFDRDYVEHWSLWTDLVIIAKTVPAVVVAKGTY
ncbi:sugar transferase [Chelatococcus sp. GCM10030263]|uniref:sugar transferase n=1 Tax=Chelatococcus sp. GCM10030263 TaxID=3273387 RepID=UPI0036228438